MLSWHPPSIREAALLALVGCSPAQLASSPLTANAVETGIASSAAAPRAGCGCGRRPICLLSVACFCRFFFTAYRPFVMARGAQPHRQRRCPTKLPLARLLPRGCCCPLHSARPCARAHFSPLQRALAPILPCRLRPSVRVLLSTS